MTNVSFHEQGVYDIEEFVTQHQIENKIDLIIVGTAFHWFDIPRAIDACHRTLLRSNGILAVWAYKYFYILTKDIETDIIKP